MCAPLAVKVLRFALAVSHKDRVVGRILFVVMKLLFDNRNIAGILLRMWDHCLRNPLRSPVRHGNWWAIRLLALGTGVHSQSFRKCHGTPGYLLDTWPGHCSSVASLRHRQSDPYLPRFSIAGSGAARPPLRRHDTLKKRFRLAGVCTALCPGSQRHSRWLTSAWQGYRISTLATSRWWLVKYLPRGCLWTKLSPVTGG